MEANKKNILPWVIVGVLALVVLGGGIYVYFDLNKNTANQQAQAGNQFQALMQNPALQAATSLLRLAQNSELALSADQKTAIKPVLQELIDTTDPSEAFLQQKADVLTGVLTADQKKFLETQQNTMPGGNRTGGQGNWNGTRPGGRNVQPGDGQAGDGQAGDGQSGGGQFGAGQFRGGQNGGSAGAGRAQIQMQPQELYKRVLDSLQ